MAEGAARWPSRDVSFCETRGVRERSRIPEKRSGRRNSQNFKKKKKKKCANVADVNLVTNFVSLFIIYLKEISYTTFYVILNILTLKNVFKTE